METFDRSKITSSIRLNLERAPDVGRLLRGLKNISGRRTSEEAIGNQKSVQENDRTLC